ncbi:hypothetical protein MMK25_34450, partial [Bacillus cereus]|nr:hypothetical protein [Bacillus cereus]
IRNNSELIPTLDIRDPKVFNTDGRYRLIRVYDKEKGAGTGEESWSSQIFHQGKLNYTNTPSYLNFEKYIIDLYLYVDKVT